MTTNTANRSQFMRILLADGLLDAVNAAIAASGDRVLQIRWANDASFDESNPVVVAMVTGLGWVEGRSTDLLTRASAL